MVKPTECPSSWGWTHSDEQSAWEKFKKPGWLCGIMDNMWKYIHIYMEIYNMNYANMCCVHIYISTYLYMHIYCMYMYTHIYTFFCQPQWFFWSAQEFHHCQSLPEWHFPELLFNLLSWMIWKWTRKQSISHQGTLYSSSVSGGTGLVICLDVVLSLAWYPWQLLVF